MKLPLLLETVWTDDVEVSLKKKNFLNVEYNSVKREKSVHFDNMKTSTSVFILRNYLNHPR